MPIYHDNSYTTNPFLCEIPIIPCKYCNGEGWIEEDIEVKAFTSEAKIYHTPRFTNT